MKNCCVAICALCALIVVAAHPASAQLRALETEHLQLVYIDGLQSFIAPHAARCYENAYRFHEDLWGSDLPDKVTVFLHDSGDQGNGGAKNTPTNMIVCAVAPFSYAYETMPANERINTIMNHELAHIFSMDLTAGSDRFFRGLFWGKPESVADQPLSILYEYMVTPRRAAPRWYLEGIAVFLETWMAGGYGRALGAYDEMVFRTKVLEGARFYGQVGLEAEGNKIDLHVGVNSYLYGTRFYSYLALKYGPRKIMDWVNRAGGTRAYFMSQFRQTFGLSLDQAWKEWVQWEHEFQRQNLDAIREYPLTEHRDITGHPLGAVSRSYVDQTTNELYVAVDRPGELAHIAAIKLNDGSSRNLTDIKGPSLFFVTSQAYDPQTRTLFYTTDNYEWRDLNSINVETGETRLLMKDARIGDLAFNAADSSLWGVRHRNGISTVVYMNPPYTKQNVAYIWPYGKDVYDLDISPDGQWAIASLAEVSGRQRLIRMSVDGLRNRDTSFTELHNFGSAIPQSFVFSDDGRYLYGASYYTGVSNIWRYDLAADSMEALTNAETGFFRPIPLGGDSLLVYRYATDGFVPCVIHAQPLTDINAIRFLGQEVVNDHPVVTNWMAGSPGEIDLESVTVSEYDYNVMQRWKLMSIYPVVEGYKNTTALGLRLNLADELGLHGAEVTASYTPETSLPEDERWHVDGSYSYFNWDLEFAYNGTDFYDLFGPTRTSRKGYSAGLHYSRTLIYDDPRRLDLRLGVSGYGGLERLPDYQNVATSYDNFASANASLNYRNMRASLGAVDYEKGHALSLSTGATYVLEELYPQFVAGGDIGVPLPIPHSSLWLRATGGFSTRDRDEPFANFFFGGFGNNWVDHRAVKRYRNWYSFPGKELNELNGTTFTRGMLEWNLPPLRFRRLGFPALYCSWARFSLFTAGLSTNIDDDNLRTNAVSVGSQMDLSWQLLSQLRLTLSFGYGRAWVEHMRGTDEYMISLKIL